MSDACGGSMHLFVPSNKTQSDCAQFLLCVCFCLSLRRVCCPFCLLLFVIASTLLLCVFSRVCFPSFVLCDPSLLLCVLASILILDFFRRVCHPLFASQFSILLALKLSFLMSQLGMHSVTAQNASRKAGYPEMK